MRCLKNYIRGYKNAAYLRYYKLAMDCFHQINEILRKEKDDQKHKGTPTTKDDNEKMDFQMNEPKKDPTQYKKIRGTDGRDYVIIPFK